MAEAVYVDRNGLAFADHYGRWKHGEFFPPNRVNDPSVPASYHWTWDHSQVSGMAFGHGAVILEAHHLVGGTQGRSDERCNLIMLTREEHEAVKTHRLTMGTLLWCKWRTDRANTDWERLAVLMRKFLPELEPDPRIVSLYRYNRSVRPRDQRPWIE